MKELIKHLLKNNSEEILEKSLLNCHAKGLHSIMLSEAPGKTIRLYVAVPGHTLNKNFPGDSNNLSLAFHPHHCNLTLHCIKGKFTNWEVEEGDTGFQVDKYLYQSKITTGEMAFKKIGSTSLHTTSYRIISAGYSHHMKANELHTVGCHNDFLTAWLVYEGKEDANYTSFCYSKRDPNTIDYTELYQKPTMQEVLNLLSDCDLL